MHSTKSKAIVAYVPALHAGYLSFFRKHADAGILVLGKSFIDAYPRLNRDLRALDPQEAVSAIAALGIVAGAVRVIEIPDIAALEAFETIILPDEDVSRDFAEKYLARKKHAFESIFLRWDKQIMDFEKEPPPDRVVSTQELDKELMHRAFEEGNKSADWWRQVGSILVRDGKILLSSHIRYFPSDLALDVFGTPRSNVDAGERPDVYISMHSEADIVAQAAKAGISLSGASLYVSTFPCINCAFLIARSGIAKIYYSKGYSRLDAEVVLKNAGVEVVLVRD